MPGPPGFPPGPPKPYAADWHTTDCSSSSSALPASGCCVADVVAPPLAVKAPPFRPLLVKSPPKCIWDWASALPPKPTRPPPMEEIPVSSADLLLAASVSSVALPPPPPPVARHVVMEPPQAKAPVAPPQATAAAPVRVPGEFPQELVVGGWAVVWQVQGDGTGAWIDYDLECSCLLESAFRGTEKVFTRTPRTNLQYTYDVSQHVQINHKYHTHRMHVISRLATPKTHVKPSAAAAQCAGRRRCTLIRRCDRVARPPTTLNSTVY